MNRRRFFGVLAAPLFAALAAKRTPVITAKEWAEANWEIMPKPAPALTTEDIAEAMRLFGDAGSGPVMMMANTETAKRLGWPEPEEGWR